MKCSHFFTEKKDKNVPLKIWQIKRLKFQALFSRKYQRSDSSQIGGGRAGLGRLGLSGPGDGVQQCELCTPVGWALWMSGS